MPAEARPNPLAPSKRSVTPTAHPAMAHARVWNHVNSMEPEQLASKTTETAYALPIIGALAANPKVTRKDVIKAAADAAGAGKIKPSQAVEIISGMPDDPAKLRPWLRDAYAANLSGLVHMKAAMMPDPAPSQGVPQS